MENKVSKQKQKPMPKNQELLDFESWIAIAQSGNRVDELYEQAKTITDTSHRATNTALRSLTLGVTGGIAIIIAFTDSSNFNWVWSCSLTALVVAAAIIVVGTGLETLRWDAYDDSFKSLTRKDYDKARKRYNFGTKVRSLLRVLNYLAIGAFLAGVALGLYGLWT